MSETPAELRERARKAKRMAAALYNDDASDRLRKLADELEKRADELEADPPA